MKISYKADTTAIKDKLYPLVEEAMKSSSIKNAYKSAINDFMSKRAEALYDTLPCDRIICSEIEMDNLFKAVKIPKEKVTEVIKETYYGNLDHFTPLAAKHEFTILQQCIIRYFALEKQPKDAELAMLYLAFSGKFYPSLHYRSYPLVVPVRHIMEYVVNNQLTNKFDLKTKGNVIGAVKSVGCTWLDAYKDKFKSYTDEDSRYLIQQLYSRIGSFIKNIATEYYKVYDNKDSYITYQSDSFDADDFHLADSDTLRISKATEATINHINSYGVEYKLCSMCSNTDITPSECKAVIESIVNNKDNIITMKELISIMIALYYETGKNDLTDINFITFTIAPKPNAKQKEIVRLKDIIEEWLSESGTAYVRRRSRLATKNSYERAVKLYFALVIHNSNR